MTAENSTDRETRPDATIRCGPFELIAPVGEGGMGWVWRGTYVGPGDEMPVAVKVLGKLGLPTEEDRDLFQREVQAQAGLNHPGVAVVFDYGELPEAAAAASGGRLEAGAPYIAMEFAEQGTLVDAGWPSNWAACRALLLELLDALGHAHARGLIHRDLKPENILVFADADPPGRWKLTDFGIAHATDRVRTEGTSQVATPEAGTPHYMAPEQFFRRWREFGPWTDLYQIGCVAYEIVCGKVPFDQDSLPAFAKAHAEDPFPDLQPRFAVPDGLERWIRRLTAKRPGDRFMRAADAARALSELEDDDLAGGDLEMGTGESIGTVTTLDPAGTDSRATAPTVTESTEPTRKGGGTLGMWGDEDPSTARDGELAGLGAQQTVEVRDVAFPTTWRMERPDGGRDRLIGAGLGLFDLREVPFVDRDDERDAIWSKLREVIERGRPTALRIQGPSGTGKSRLAQWTVRRADELGACIVLRATHDRQGGPGTDLRGMFERWLSSWGLDRDQIRELAVSRLQTYVGSEATEEEDLDALASELAAFLRPEATDEEGDRAGYQSEQNRHAALGRLVRLIATRRPVLIWLDDVQWAERSLQFVHHVLGDSRYGPVMFLLTRRPTDEDPGPAMSGVRLEGRDVETLELEPLSREDHAEFVDALLPLAPDLADKVCELSAGHPMFAEHLVREWVAEEALRVGPDGFELREEVDRGVPDRMHDLWMRRIESLLDGLPSDDRADNRRSLELGAALGRQVDRTEWRAACAEAGLAPSDRLVERLAARGLVSFESDIWSFAHSMLVEALEQSARSQGRLQDHHRACAEMLAGGTVARTGQVARREAHHRIEAGEPTGALDPLLEAADWAGERGDYTQEARDLEGRADLIEDLGLADDSRRRVENWTRSAMNALWRGEVETAEEFATRALGHAQSKQWPELQAKSLTVLAGVEKDRSEYRASLDRLETAQTLFESTGDRQGVARSRRLKGEVHRQVGHFARAEELFDRAREEFEELDDVLGQLRCNRSMMWTLSEREAFREAEEAAREVIDAAESLGAWDNEASGWNMLGDLAKLRGEYGKARKSYQKAIELLERGASRNVVVIALNRTMVEIADRDFEGKAEILTSLEEQLREAGFPAATPFVDLGRAALAAWNGDWEQWDDHLGELTASLEDDAATHRDLAWFSETVADITAEQGDASRARRLLEVAHELWVELGDYEAADRLAERLDSE